MTPLHHQLPVIQLLLVLSLLISTGSTAVINRAHVVEQRQQQLVDNPLHNQQRLQDHLQGYPVERSLKSLYVKETPHVTDFGSRMDDSFTASATTTAVAPRIGDPTREIESRHQQRRLRQRRRRTTSTTTRDNPTGSMQKEETSQEVFSDLLKDENISVYKDCQHSSHLSSSRCWSSNEKEKEDGRLRPIQKRAQPASTTTTTTTSTQPQPPPLRVLPSNHPPLVLPMNPTAFASTHPPKPKSDPIVHAASVAPLPNTNPASHKGTLHAKHSDANTLTKAVSSNYTGGIESDSDDEKEEEQEEIAEEEKRRTPKSSS